MRKVKDQHEVDVTPPDRRDVDLGHPMLSELVRLRLFMTYFCWLADRRYPASHRPETRVANHRRECRCLYWTCVFLDLVVLGAAVVLALRVAYKGIWL